MKQSADDYQMIIVLWNLIYKKTGTLENGDLYTYATSLVKSKFNVWRNYEICSALPLKYNTLTNHQITNGLRDKFVDRQNDR